VSERLIEVKAALKSLEVPLAKSAIGDKTDEGVISHGHLPTVGTLERALRKRDIPSVTFETPVESYDLKHRVELQIKFINTILSNFN
jgi:hypothetical protein